MSAGETTSRRKLKAIEIEGLVRALPGEMVERALDRALEGLEGEAAAAVKALPRPVDPATIQVSALPDEALTAVGAILLDAACQAALKGDSEPRIQAVAPANE